MAPRFPSSARERKTSAEIGEYFEAKAKQILSAIGFTKVRDGPTLAPYDLTASKDGTTFYIEVKGSQSEKLGVSYVVQAGKLTALSRLQNVLFLFIAGKDANRWKLVEFDKLRDLQARVRLYSSNFKVGVAAVGREKGYAGNPRGRPRTLLGTRQVPLRIDRRLVDLLDEQAEEEGLSRQVLMTRLLSDAVRAHLARPKDKKA